MRNIGTFSFPEEKVKTGGIVTAKVILEPKNIINNPNEIRKAVSNPINIFLDVTIKDGDDRRIQITEADQFYNGLDALESTYCILGYFLGGGVDGPSEFTTLNASLIHAASSND